GFRERAPRGHLQGERAPLASDHGTIGIGLAEPAQKLPAPRAAAPAGWEMIAIPAGPRHRARSLEASGMKDFLFQAEEEIEGRAMPRPINTGLNGSARGDPDRGHAAAALARRQTCHGAHQRLANRQDVSLLEERLKAVPILIVSQREAV